MERLVPFAEKTKEKQPDSESYTHKVHTFNKIASRKNMLRQTRA